MRRVPAKINAILRRNGNGKRLFEGQICGAAKFSAIALKNRAAWIPSVKQ